MRIKIAYKSLEQLDELTRRLSKSRLTSQQT